MWLQQVSCLANNNAQGTMWKHQILMLEIHWAKTLNSSNPQIYFIHHQGIVNRLHSHHFQALPSSATLPHSAWHQPHNQAVVQPKNIRVISHHGKDMTSPMEGMVKLKCSPLNNSQIRRHHLQGHLDCLQYRLETFQSFGRHPLPSVSKQFQTARMVPG